MREGGEDARREIEAGEDQSAFEQNPFPNVAVDVVRQFVRQDDFDLILRVFGEHRVRHEDAPGTA